MASRQVNRNAHPARGPTRQAVRQTTCEGVRGQLLLLCAGRRNCGASQAPSSGSTWPRGALTPCLQSQIGQGHHLGGQCMGAGRGCHGVVRGCPLGTGQDCCEWHDSGTAVEDDVVPVAPLALSLASGLGPSSVATASLASRERGAAASFRFRRPRPVVDASGAASLPEPETRAAGPYQGGRPG
jgi:hypothetical protein